MACESMCERVLIPEQALLMILTRLAGEDYIQSLASASDAGPGKAFLTGRAQIEALLADLVGFFFLAAPCRCSH